MTCIQWVNHLVSQGFHYHFYLNFKFQTVSESSVEILALDSLQVTLTTEDDKGSLTQEGVTQFTAEFPLQVSSLDIS